MASAQHTSNVFHSHAQSHPETPNISAIPVAHDKPASISPHLAQQLLMKRLAKAEDELVAKARQIILEHAGRSHQRSDLGALEDCLVEAVQEASAVFYKLSMVQGKEEAWAVLQRTERLIALFDGTQPNMGAAKEDRFISTFAPRKTFIDRRPLEAVGTRPVAAPPAPTLLLALSPVTIATCKAVLRDLYRTFEHKRQSETGKLVVQNAYLSQRNNENHDRLDAPLSFRQRPNSASVANGSAAKSYFTTKTSLVSQIASDAARTAAVPAHHRALRKATEKKPIRPASASAKTMSGKHYARPLSRFTSAEKISEGDLASSNKELTISNKDPLGASSRDSDRYYGKAMFGPPKRPATASSAKTSTRPHLTLNSRPPSALGLRTSSSMEGRSDALIPEDDNECDDEALNAAFASKQLKCDPRPPSALGGARPNILPLCSTTGRPLSSSERRNWRPPTPVEVYLPVDGSTAPDEGEKSLIKFMGLEPKSSADQVPIDAVVDDGDMVTPPMDKMDDILNRVRLASQGLGIANDNNGLSALSPESYFHETHKSTRSGIQAKADHFLTPQSPFARLQQVLANTARNFLARRRLKRRQDEIARLNNLRPFQEDREYYSQKMEDTTANDLLAIAYYEKQSMAHTNSIEAINYHFELQSNIAEALELASKKETTASSVEDLPPEREYCVRPPKGEGIDPLVREYPFEAQRFAWHNVMKSGDIKEINSDHHQTNGASMLSCDPSIEPIPAAADTASVPKVPKPPPKYKNYSNKSAQSAMDAALDDDIRAAKEAFEDFRRVLRRTY